jgi:hypothetical protein
VIGLLNKAALSEAAHDLYTVFYQDAEQAVGLPASDWRQIPRLDDAVQLPVIAYYLGRVHQAWGFDPGLVLHHMGIASDDHEGQTLAIYRLLMGCLGHGVSLEDDHADALEAAGEILGKSLDPNPIDFEGREWAELAAETVQSRLNSYAPSDDAWPVQPGETIDFEVRLGTGDTIPGPGTVTKCLDTTSGLMVVVRLPHDHGERPGELVVVPAADVLG